MTKIRLHNTKTRTKQDFTPIDDQNVRMYVCGPTVYDRAHLGNARPVVVFDVLYRLLRHVYGPDHVTYVRNFTDVDDKINAEALRRQQAGDTRSLEALIHERTDETIAWYHADMDALGALRPNFEPRATEFIAPMVAMIEGLIASGHAYAVQGHVLFRVRSYKSYGALSGRSVDDMIAGARVEVSPFKEDPMDFVLWKPSSVDEPGWNSPWGRGRPGWHIECSAMADELLMKDLPEDQKSFDIHAGGMDLQFPHHENEIAQSACAHPKGGFANVWMHNEMLQVEGKKMSKSLGNFFTVRDLLNGVPTIAAGKISGDEMRAAFLLSHYRNQMDFGVPRRQEARAAVTDMAHTLGKYGSHALQTLEHGQKLNPLDEVVDALADDLDTSKAIGLLRRKSLAKRYSPDEQSDPTHLQRIYDSQRLLGFLLTETTTAVDASHKADRELSSIGEIINMVFKSADQVDRLEAAIDEARLNKDFIRADALKKQVVDSGARVEIGPDGAKIMRLSSFDIAKFEAIK